MALPLVGCAIALVLVNLTWIYDLDFGFHLATGRYLLQHGIPQTEFFVPPLGDRPYASLFLLSDLIIAFLWQMIGPSSLILLKALGYGGGFFLMGWVAIRRGVPVWLAALVTTIMACAISARFVERPGFFSVLFLGMMFLFFEVYILPLKKKLSWWLPIVSGVFFSVWSFLHAEFYLGLFVMGSLFLARLFRNDEWKSLRSLMIAGSSLSLGLFLPIILFALIHPDSIQAVLAPFAIAKDAEDVIPVREYQLSVWKLQMASIPCLLLVVLSAVRIFRESRWPEAMMLAVFILLSFKIPRAALPAMVLGTPYVAEWIGSFSFISRYTAKGWLVGLSLPVVAMVTVQLLPSRQFGVTMEPTLDTRGVGEVLERVDQPAGIVLASFGLASLLLSNDSVVRQGVVMDGRAEAYTGDYFRSIYLPCFDPEAPGWKGHLASINVGFYFEPYIPDNPMADDFQRIGWKLIGWDNSGRLFARPDIVEEYKIFVYQVDPARLEAMTRVDRQGLVKAEKEVYARIIDLEMEGIIVQHGWVAHARLLMALGYLQRAEISLDAARLNGAQRFQSYGQTVDLLSKIK